MNSQLTYIQTFWEMLVDDPNNIDKLTQWIELHQGQFGPSETLQALRRAADLPNSWLAKIWLTRPLLEKGQLDISICLYKEALRLAPRKSLAVQEISGHLGQAGYFEESLKLLLPVYSPADHGPFAGLNLFNACEDSSNWEAAQHILDRMKTEDWPSPLKEIIRIRQEKLDLHQMYAKWPNPELN